MKHTKQNVADQGDTRLGAHAHEHRNVKEQNTNQKMQNAKCKMLQTKMAHGMGAHEHRSATLASVRKVTHPTTVY